jgi:glycosyltransferase involved in cell wall biosynthesis
MALATREDSGVKKVLIVSPVATHPPHRGNRQRILQIANLFKASGYALELAVGSNRPIAEEAREFWPTIHRLQRNPGWKPSHRVATLDSWYTEGLGEELAKIVVDREIDVVLLNYIFHSRALEYLPKSVVTIIDTHDVFTNRHELYSGKRFAGGFFSCTAADEATYLSRADVTLAITDEESQHFRAIQDTSSVFSIPFVMPETRLTSLTKAPNNGALSFGMVLSANDLNLASLADFIHQVDKHYGQKPPFKVHVAGGIDKFAYRYLPHRIPKFYRQWLRYHGEVADLGDFYQSMDAIVVPVIAGSGMAIKFAEAISRGVPVISTITGSRGHPSPQPFHSLPDNESVVEVLGRLGVVELLDLAAESKQCHESLLSSSTRNWREVTKFLNRPVSKDIAVP